jgi:hypothetical protein
MFWHSRFSTQKLIKKHKSNEWVPSLTYCQGMTKSCVFLKGQRITFSLVYVKKGLERSCSAAANTQLRN